MFGLNIDTSPTGPLSFLYSRKAWVSLAVIAAVAVMLYLGKVTNEEFVEMLKYVFTVWVGAMAVEKSAKVIGTKNVVNNTTTKEENGDE